MTGYPVQLSKIQCPTLRDETLARDRLLDWLAAKAHSRVLLILADAGYGKTTLLADFSRRTRLRTIWYRLDEDDRDWVAFLSHLVAAGREHDPEFGAVTAAVLADESNGGPAREAATEAFLRELPTIAAQGVVLILDDFHLVDDSVDVRAIVRELVVHGPERLSIAFASRRPPSVPIARLRASGEVAELGTDDLRFDASETARLFSETYGRDLEPDVLADVTARTEGWAASLQLVHAALRDRSPAEIRRFVRSLNGADRELYDYLAEEVVGDLPDDLQHFLMCTSLLQVVTPDLAAVASGYDASDVRRLTSIAERMTLLSRPGRGSRGQRFHPLVREFLEARLRSTITEAQIAALHLRVADAAAEQDWRTAAHHYREAGEHASVATTIASALPEIIGRGQHGAAGEEIGLLPDDLTIPGLDLVRSRIQMQQRETTRALALSTSVLATVDPGSSESDYALLNIAGLHMQAGSVGDSLRIAEQLLDTTSDEHLRMIARGMSLLVASSRTGDLVVLSNHLSTMAAKQRGIYPHFFGVTMLNLALVATLRDRPNDAIGFATEAIDALEGTSSRLELAAAYMARGVAQAHLGALQEAEVSVEQAAAYDEIETQFERGDLADSLLNPLDAEGHLEVLARNSSRSPEAEALLFFQQAWFFGRRGRFGDAEHAQHNLASLPETTMIGFGTARACVAAYVAVVTDAPDGLSVAIDAGNIAAAQGAIRWQRIAELLRAYVGVSDELSATVMAVGSVSPWNLTHLADLVTNRLDELSEPAYSVVVGAAQLHPARWRFVLRNHVDAAKSGEARRASVLLDAIGEMQDVGRLRGYARRQRRATGATALGRGLARRLAPRAFVEDQGQVSIHVGGRQVPGSATRRKVLSLLCFLLSRSNMTSTRDQVLDAIWPDLDPVDALNSLNQTVYFLRRVLEEHYVDDLSPGYLHHDSDLIWLDTDLVGSRSNLCRRLIRDLPPAPAPEQVAELVNEYHGRFALDFEYEEWATHYRDWLHASYLEIVERAVVSDLETGHFDRGIALARRVLEIDPTAESVELSLLRLYRASGAHAAAAEQYGHYASQVREQLGVEPPALDDL